MEIAQKIINTQDLATIPTVATRVLRYMESDDSDFKGLTKIIESDPSLSVKIIKVANSPLYSSRVPTSNLSQAISKLGMNKISNIVLGVSIFSKFLIASRDEIKSFLEKFWWHSACTATVARAITQKIGLNFQEKEFIVSLLHDVGKLAMLQYDLESFKKVMELVEFDREHPFEVEERLFGINHRNLGYEIVKKWELPEDLTEIFKLEYSHEQTKETKLLISIINLANIFCEVWGAGFFGGVNEIIIEETESWLYLQENTESEIEIEKFTFELENEFKYSQEFLNAIKN